MQSSEKMISLFSFILQLEDDLDGLERPYEPSFGCVSKVLALDLSSISSSLREKDLPFLTPSGFSSVDGVTHTVPLFFSFSLQTSS